MSNGLARTIIAASLLIVSIGSYTSAQNVATTHKSTHPGGPLMTSAEYSAFLARVTDAAMRWTVAFEKIDMATMDISYARGEEIMKYRNLALSQLSTIRSFVGEEHVKPRLWRQIMLATSLQSTADTYANILYMLPQDKVPPEWDATYLKMAPEAGGLVMPLLNHVEKRADMLEP